MSVFQLQFLVGEIPFQSDSGLNQEQDQDFEGKVTVEDMPWLSKGAKERLGTLTTVAQTTFHWTYVPLIIYLGKLHV